MDDNKKENKVSKKVARSKKSAASKKSADKPENAKSATKSSLVNDGKCCRCSFRNSEKKCSCKNSKSAGKYVARKFGCSSFKYA